MFKNPETKAVVIPASSTRWCDREDETQDTARDASPSRNLHELRSFENAVPKHYIITHRDLEDFIEQYPPVKEAHMITLAHTYSQIEAKKKRDTAYENAWYAPMVDGMLKGVDKLLDLIL